MSSTPVEVHRDGKHSFTASNGRGARVAIGREGAPESFTPGELLLAAIAGCSAVTTENLLVRRLGDSAELVLRADRDKDPEDQHKFSSIRVRFDVDLSGIEDGTERDRLVDAAERAVRRFCTVSRSVEESTPVELVLPREVGDGDSQR